MYTKKREERTRSEGKSRKDQQTNKDKDGIKKTDRQKDKKLIDTQLLNPGEKRRNNQEREKSRSVEKEYQREKGKF